MSVQNDIESQTEQFSVEANVRIEFEERVDRALGKAKSYLKSRKVNEASHKQISSSNVQNLKLPTIDIPTFDGDLTKWKSFEDAFNALIDKNDSISEVLKLYYLRGALSGEALSIVESLETTASNYRIAYDLLKKRFDHRRRTIYAHAN